MGELQASNKPHKGGRQVVLLTRSRAPRGEYSEVVYPLLRLVALWSHAIAEGHRSDKELDCISHACPIGILIPISCSITWCSNPLSYTSCLTHKTRLKQHSGHFLGSCFIKVISYTVLLAKLAQSIPFHRERQLLEVLYYPSTPL